MSILIVIIHVVVSIALILIVLLQTGKGADMGAAFGGGSSQTLFGTTGASTFLSKLTTAAAIVFMLTSLILAYMHSHRSSGSILSNDAPLVSTPAQENAPTQPATNADTNKPAAEPKAATQDAAPSSQTQGATQESTQGSTPSDQGKGSSQ
jgi:preprotein translocase subunit SecG